MSLAFGSVKYLKSVGHTFQAAASQLRELNEVLRQKRVLREANVSPQRQSENLQYLDQQCDK